MALRRSREPKPAAERADSGAARAAGLAWLGRRDFGREALRARLCRDGFTPETAAGVVAEFIAAGLIDDRRFAENYVTWHAGRGHGPVRIAMELKRLGLADDLVQAVLQGGEPDWVAVACRVRAAKFGAGRPSGWPEQARQARFLQYRGFSADHIRAAMDADFDLD
jgi:regulatory protein